MEWVKWRRGASAILCGAMVCLTGCSTGTAPKTGKTVVVLVDRSASTGADRNLYARALDRVLGGLQPGDRIIGAWITESSAGDFRDYLDEELPAPFPSMQIWDVASKYKEGKKKWEEDIEQSRNRIREGMEHLMQQPSASAKTKIFESLRVVGQILASELRAKKILLLLSDMVEDSETANFEGGRLDKAFVGKEIGRQRQMGILPDLRGVEVFVAGVRGEPVDRAAAIEQFWRAYFAETGAVVGPGAISRALPSFGE